MRRSNNIFRQERYRGTGFRSISGVAIVTGLLSMISILAAIYVIKNFGEVTARIAIWIANSLSTGVPILLIIVIIMFLVMRWRWRMYRRYWRL